MHMKTPVSKYILPVLVCVFGCLFMACIEDDFSTSPSDQPVFQTDTLNMGLIFTEDPSPTSRMVVYNPHSKGLNISSISISGENAACFRANVDGLSGDGFSNIEIRAKDSIFVFVEATLPEVSTTRPTEITAKLNFLTNGITQSVTLSATAQNVKRLRAETITGDTRLTADIPYQVFDSLVVAPGSRLTLDPGTTLHFHDKAMLVVRGSLHSLGTAEQPVNMCGDRTGNVVADISFDIMASQWTGVFFTPGSSDNRLEYTDIRNTVQGVYIQEAPLTLVNSRLHNSAMLGLEAFHADITAVGTEFAEAGQGLVYLNGGTHSFNNCTFANNYLFTAISGPALFLSHLGADPALDSDDGSGMPYLKADFNNCIIYGLGADIYPGDLSGTQVMVRRCLIKSEGSDDDNFINCIWGEDPLYYTVRNDYIFDYRLKPDSPAIGAADASLIPSVFPATDFYGTPRRAPYDLGAYVFTEPE